MQLKIKHKMTFDYPQMLAGEITRSNRKNKTMLRSFHGNKQGSPFDVQMHFNRQQKHYKSLLQTKIEQLHNKMKIFFANQRKNHFEELGLQMIELKRMIVQLREQISRPKSMQEIQNEKHRLLKRKHILLKQIEQINKNSRQHKADLYELKFQRQQLDRQLLNGIKTIEKYKKRLRQIGKNSLSTFDKNIECQKMKQLFQQQEKQCNEVQKILNESLCENLQTENSSKRQKKKLNQNDSSNKKIVLQERNDLESGNIHITQINDEGKSQRKKLNGNNCLRNKNLPLITKNNKLNAKECKQSISENSVLQKYQKHSINQNQQRTKLCNYQKLQRQKEKLKLKVYENKQNIEKKVQLLLQNSHSKNILRNVPYQSECHKLQGFNQVSKNIYQPIKQIHKSRKQKTYQLDLSFTMKKYEQLIKSKKWQKINKHLQTFSPNLNQNKSSNKNKQKSATIKQPVFLNSSDLNTNQQFEINQINKSQSLSNIQQILMDQLRKKQFYFFKEKGYHEGLNNKTHQIRLQLKNIFKNYSTDQFFDSIMSKKIIKKQLEVILQSSIN